MTTTQAPSRKWRIDGIGAAVTVSRWEGGSWKQAERIERIEPQEG